MNSLLLTLLLTYVTCERYWPLGPPSDRSFNWRELYYPKLLDTVNVQKPLQGLSVTNGENPVDTPNIFSKIFYPAVEEEKEEDKKEGTSLMAKGKEALDKLKEVAASFTNFAAGLKNLFG